MPTLITLPLLSDNAHTVPANPARALQAIIYNWLREVDAELATQIHDQTRGAKPYALSGLVRQRDGGDYHWYLTILDDELFPALMPVISNTKMLDIAGTTVLIDQANVHREESSYQRILEGATAETLLHMRFLSPTSFRSGGLVYPLPEPFMCWQSWLSRWNAFAPPDLRLNVVLLDAAQAHVAVNRFNLRTEAIRFESEDRYQIGFVGDVTFAMINSHLLDTTVLRQLNALANYADFCGTGHATTRGLGQTRRLSSRDYR